MLFGSRFSLCVYCAPRGNDYPYFQCMRATQSGGKQLTLPHCTILFSKTEENISSQRIVFPLFWTLPMQVHFSSSTVFHMHAVETDFVVCKQYFTLFYENRCDPNALTECSRMPKWWVDTGTKQKKIRFKSRAIGDGRKLKKRQFPHHSKLTKISANRLLPLLNCKHINSLTTFPPARTHCIGPLEILWPNTTFGVRFVFVHTPSTCQFVWMNQSEQQFMRRPYWSSGQQQLSLPFPTFRYRIRAIDDRKVVWTHRTKYQSAHTRARTILLVM